jgi:hypothetical protein
MLHGGNVVLAGKDEIRKSKVEIRKSDPGGPAEVGIGGLPGKPAPWQYFGVTSDTQAIKDAYTEKLKALTR